MKSKLLNAGLIISSLMGYLEWGGNNSMFLFEGELDVLTKLWKDPLSALHPFTLMPLIGQVLLVFTLFQKKPSKLITYIGIACIGLLLLFMLVIGAVGTNFKVLVSVVPFWVLVYLVIRHNRKMMS
ncbi:MAG: hypothetical protein R3A50_01985 [Saprospiraceae bacterium]|nr:hypothetical protein [Saprospiraceae bacterium]MCB9344042.1 hypothetical protein [Lewinellaceae bacterium]